MFEYKFKVLKQDSGTTFGSISINNIVFEPGEIEKALPEIVFDDENLKHMFAEECIDDFKRKNIYRRFIPKTKLDVEIVKFVEESIRANVTFYSFLAEGILGLVFRDIYGYKLSKGIIDVYDTLVDSHTGVDACMYSEEDSLFVLGEAKFYEKFDSGIKQIISDFIDKDIKNKLESLQTATENCSESNRIVVKNLSLDKYNELTIDEFMSQKIIFAGFVLHSESNISRYNEKDFYDNYSISTQELANHVNDSLGISGINGDYEIIIVHLPVSSKRNLIAKIIETAKIKLIGIKSDV